jgi:hypothetical protein
MLKRFSRMVRAVAGVLALTAGVWFTFSVPCRAAMVETESLLQAREDGVSARRQVRAYLERNAVAAQLEAWSVPAPQARARVDAMTDEEIRVLAQRIASMPAGGIDALTVIFLISVISFGTLLVTDILGITDVFPFVEKR